jgi:hypothetical protein
MLIKLTKQLFGFIEEVNCLVNYLSFLPLLFHDPENKAEEFIHKKKKKRLFVFYVICGLLKGEVRSPARSVSIASRIASCSKHTLSSSFIHA